MKLINTVFGELGQNRILALDKERAFDLAYLQQLIANLQPHLIDSPHQKYLVYETDPLLFIAALFSVISTGKEALIPQNHQLKSFEQLREDTPQLIGYAGDDIKVDISTRDLTVSKRQLLPPTQIESARISFCTSGSTGKPKVVSRLVKHIQDELNMFSRVWPTTQKTLFISLVSHLHIYGLSFAFLWPLFIGAPFLKLRTAGMIGGTEKIPGHATNRADSICIVASPTVVRNFRTIILESEPGGIFDSQNKMPVSRVFCAGGALDIKPAKDMASVVNCPITEILGSTETGAIATREHGLLSSGDNRVNRWHPLFGVTITADGTVATEVGCAGAKRGALSACAEHIPSVDGKSVYTGDEIIINPQGGFELLGRLDRICKVEGRRVSLEHVEKLLKSNDFIHDAVVSIQKDGQRDSISAAVELSSQGILFFQLNGKFALDSAIKKYLLEYLDATTLPKYYRYIKKIPRNNQDKVLTEVIHELLGPGASYPLVPEIVSTEKHPQGCLMSLYIPPDLVFLKGHFNTFPIVPGFILLHWVFEYFQSQLGMCLSQSLIHKIKFMRPIQPCMQVDLLLQDLGGSAQFEYKKSAEIYATGILNMRT